MLRKYKNSYFSFVLMYVGFYLAFAAYSAVLAVYLTGIGKDDREMSLILSAAGLFSLAIGPVLGYITDRARNQKLVAAALLAAIGLLGMVFAGMNGLGILFVLNGLIMSALNGLSSICERLAGESRFRYGTLRVWGTIGYATGVQGAGLAMELLPGYAMFLLTAAACGLSLLGLLGVELQPTAVRGVEGREEKPRLRALIESPQFFLFLLAAFIFSGCSGVNMNYSPVLLTGMGVSTGIVGTVLSVSTVVEIPLFLFSHKFMDRLSGKVLTAACFVLAIGQFLVYGTAESPGVVMAVIVLLKAVTSTLYMMLTLKMVRCLVPAGLTTTGLAVVGAVNSLAGIVMQNICGWLAGGWGIGTMYLFLAGCCGAGLLLTMFLRVRNTETVFS